MSNPNIHFVVRQIACDELLGTANHELRASRDCSSVHLASHLGLRPLTPRPSQGLAAMPAPIAIYVISFTLFWLCGKSNDM